MDCSRATWSADGPNEAFPGAAKSEGVFMCVNNAKILCVETERCNTNLLADKKVNPDRCFALSDKGLFLFRNAPIANFATCLSSAFRHSKSVFRIVFPTIEQRAQPGKRARKAARLVWWAGGIRQPALLAVRSAGGFARAVLVASLTTIFIEVGERLGVVDLVELGLAFEEVLLKRREVAALPSLLRRRDDSAIVSRAGWPVLGLRGHFRGQRWIDLEGG